ncbi:MAG: hypothetical protein RSE41_06400, partial [Clostridia bacterium]
FMLELLMPAGNIEKLKYSYKLLRDLEYNSFFSYIFKQYGALSLYDNENIYMYKDLKENFIDYVLFTTSIRALSLSFKPSTCGSQEIYFNYINRLLKVSNDIIKSKENFYN